MSSWIEINKEQIIITLYKAKCLACKTGTEGREFDVYEWKRIHEESTSHRSMLRRAKGECLPECEEFEIGSIGEDECVICKAPREVPV